ncbi:hypothetical protein Adt_05079 [Abeliophyllum distichum]|uniref:Uncharacterized protein n=1 Tax=Abeliophyllum distichum TaxID=126358 RepID=A0ABD1T013_9LAMI
MGPYQQTNVAAVDDLLQERYKMDQKLRESLAQARARMKHYADKNKTESHGKLYRPGYLTNEVKLGLNGLYSGLTSLRRKLHGKILPSLGSNILHFNLGDKVWIRGRVVMVEPKSCSGKEERREPTREEEINQ